MKCKNCGNECHELASFCAVCGADLKKDIPLEEQNQYVAPKKLFKDKFCVKCGKKVNIFTRNKLDDGTYVCGDCQPVLPTFASDCIKNCSLEHFEAICEYVKYSETLDDVFTETASLGKVKMDEIHKLFYIDDGFLGAKLYLEFKNVIDFDLAFVPTEYKEGVFTEKVIGDVKMRLVMAFPNFCFADVIKSKVKAKAHTKFLSNDITYETPYDMQNFLYSFVSAWSEIQEDNTDYQNEASELQKALALFMIDDIKTVTLEDLKEQRKRLIMTFHPDSGNTEDSKFAQKINSAYDIIKEAITK